MSEFLIFIGVVMDVTLRGFYKIYPVTGIITINKLQVFTYRVPSQAPLKYPTDSAIPPNGSFMSFSYSKLHEPV